MQGFSKKIGKNWEDNKITVNRDDKYDSKTRKLDLLNQMFIYYGLNRRLHGDNGPLENSIAEHIHNPVFRLYDIFLKRIFTGDDIKDLQFVISALLSDWITLD